MVKYDDVECGARARESENETTENSTCSVLQSPFRVPLRALVSIERSRVTLRGRECTPRECRVCFAGIRAVIWLQVLRDKNWREKVRVENLGIEKCTLQHGCLHFCKTSFSRAPLSLSSARLHTLHYTTLHFTTTSIFVYVRLANSVFLNTLTYLLTCDSTKMLISRADGDTVNNRPVFSLSFTLDCATRQPCIEYMVTALMTIPARP